MIFKCLGLDPVTLPARSDLHLHVMIDSDLFVRTSRPCSSPRCLGRAPVPQPKLCHELAFSSFARENGAVPARAYKNLRDLQLSASPGAKTG